jgi:uncharacterized protein (TIGR02391 family)
MSMTWFGPVPTALVRTLPTPELALQLLVALAAQSDPINENSTLRGAEMAYAQSGEADKAFLLKRLADAWTWLESHGLIGRHEKQTESEWQRVTTEGREVAEHRDALTKLWAGERLVGILDPLLEEKVRPIFNLGDYETACFAAMKVVEVEVRRVSGLDTSIIGVDLMRQAFKLEGGPLADSEAQRGEQVAIMELFAGAIGAFKNPSSHRTVHFDDPLEAAEVVQTADLLLRLLRRAEARLRTEN